MRISSHLEHDIKVPKNTVNDCPLMLAFSKFDPSPAELEALNQCHLYLQAYYISDLATASGRNLSYHAWEGKPRDCGHTSRCTWPYQGPLSRAAWDTWRKFIKTTIVSRGLHLKDDLGPWVRHDFDIWPWYFFLL